MIVKVAAVQAAYTLMDQKACAGEGGRADPPGSRGRGRHRGVPGGVHSGHAESGSTRGPIWDGDDDWYALLVDQAVVLPGPVTRRAGAPRPATPVPTWWSACRNANRTGPRSTTPPLYFGPEGTLLGKHRKLIPTGSERTVWGMGDGSTLPVIDTPYGRLSGLTCWENSMPLVRFYLYSQGVDIWVAPTLAQGDGWIASMRHIAREARCYVIGVNPCLSVDQIPADFPHRERVWRADAAGERRWVEPGNSVIVDPAAPSWPVRPGRRRPSSTPTSTRPRSGRTAAYFDPVGHYHRPDLFQLHVDTRPRPSVVQRDDPLLRPWAG